MNSSQVGKERKEQGSLTACESVGGGTNGGMGIHAAGVGRPEGGIGQESIELCHAAEVRKFRKIFSVRALDISWDDTNHCSARGASL